MNHTKTTLHLLNNLTKQKLMVYAELARLNPDDELLSERIHATKNDDLADLDCGYCDECEKVFQLSDMRKNDCLCTTCYGRALDEREHLESRGEGYQPDFEADENGDYK